MQMKEITYKEALREAMVEEMRRDEDIIFLGEDIGVYGGGFGVSYGMIEEFGEERVHSDCKVAFAMYPTSIGELFAVADAGRLMPPKSTWFEPKLRSGLFVHALS